MEFMPSLYYNTLSKLSMAPLSGLIIKFPVFKILEKIKNKLQSTYMKRKGLINKGKHVFS